MRKNSLEDLICLNALNRISVLGPKRIGMMLKHFGSPEEAWNAVPRECRSMPELQECAGKLEKEKAKIDPDREWQQLVEQKVKCVSIYCPEYPALLKQGPFPPPLRYYRGSFDRIDQPAVAIVGSRRCTFYGREVAHRLAVELSEAGITIISGMALGVDTASHRGALESGAYTAAVLGCSVEQCYPPTNAELMEKIIESGVVLSEFPLGSAPLAGNFPRRNRIISGLSLGTVVVEATSKSGALITAHYAVEQNREVFAVPGNVGSPYSRGCHRLIKDGARLVESAADILDELYIGFVEEEQLSLDFAGSGLSEEEKKLLAALPYQPMHIDDIIKLSGDSAAAVSNMLLSLELKKCIRQTPGKYFCRI